VFCQRSLRWADHSSRGVLPTGVSECDREASIMRRPWPGMESERLRGEKNYKSGGLHVKHALSTWDLGNHLSICWKAEENQANMRRGGRAKDLSDVS
jgi:hypothetical protein